MRKDFLLVMALVSGLCFPVFAAEEEAAPESPAAETSETKPAEGTTAAAPAPEAVEKEPVAQASGGGSERDQAFTERVRELVKRFDTGSRVGKQFPFKDIEMAVRAEFMRRTEGNTTISWLGKKSVNEMDVTLAQDNLDLFLTFTERLLTMTKKPKFSPREGEELKLMAAKAVIDEHNAQMGKSSGRGLASVGGSDEMGPVGKAEMNRRRRLLGGLVAGEDYRPLKVAKSDEIGKAYKTALATAVKEYDAIATAINRATGGGAKGKRTAAK